MTYPMPPELLEQLGLEPHADRDPRWPEEHDACGLRPARRRGYQAGEAEVSRPTNGERAEPWSLTSASCTPR
jgi:hypothetical protein